MGRTWFGIERALDQGAQEGLKQHDERRKKKEQEKANKSQQAANGKAAQDNQDGPSFSRSDSW